MASTQDHIHLQPSSEMPGGGWTVDDAPDNTYIVNTINDMTGARIRVIDGITGHRHVHRLVNAGVPERVNDLSLRLKVTWAQYQTLKADLGYVCDFVPNYHENVGVSHAAQLVTVAFTEIKQPVHIDQMLGFWHITIVLMDTDTGL